MAASDLAYHENQEANMYSGTRRTNSRGPLVKEPYNENKRGMETQTSGTGWGKKAQTIGTCFWRTGSQTEPGTAGLPCRCASKRLTTTGELKTQLNNPNRLPDTQKVVDMDILGSVLEIAHSIYSLCDKASSNKKQCCRLKTRIQMLLLPAEKLNTQPEKSKELKLVLKELQLTLRNAKSWVNKYSNQGWWRKIVQANGIREEFDLINDRLQDAAEDISLLLMVEHREKFRKLFNENTRAKQNQKDIEEDLKELKEYLSSNIDCVADKLDHMTDAVGDIHDGVESILSKCNELKSLYIRTSWNITEIRATDLVRGELVMNRPSHDLYKGEYHKSPVAIKVLKGPVMKYDEDIRTIFYNEIETLKKFECLNIVRIFGICIDNSNSEPCYSMVMEYCENGTLRQLLSQKQDLTWEQRVHMTMDAARALYRLHQTGSKPILHGSLSSSKFLVDGTYCLKLSGFELSKTVSSMRRNSNVEKRKESTDWRYTAPETMENINSYYKSSEIYSLGVIVYEIATGKVPLQGKFYVVAFHWMNTFNHMVLSVGESIHN
ncbi:mixed lineage kinase domain-like protein [Rhinophrynus dorsalis]